MAFELMYTFNLINFNCLPLKSYCLPFFEILNLYFFLLAIFVHTHEKKSQISSLNLTITE